MKSILFLIVIQIITTTVSFADSVTLKCTTDTGVKAADLIIDLQNSKMHWAHYIYDIFYADDTYISAYRKPTNLGGEVWVINRITGEYKRSAVDEFCATDCSPGDKQVLLSQTYGGRCTKQQF